MPQHLPPIPGYEVATWWFPNEAVGGDYCDVFALRDGRIGLVIADVSGHGLGPSLIMASARAALRALSLGHSSTETLLNLLGHSLAIDLHDGLFITLILAALDSQQHVIEFANAGHAPAMHYDAHNKQFVPLEATGLPLGVLDEPDYPPGPTVRMQVGDLLILCTDGIVEAMDVEGIAFGQQRLENIVRDMSAAPLTDLVHKIGAEVSAHYEGDSPPDDLTILALRRNK
jgi:serine phosphatase RsbU (regulator of sigma subunit)